MESEPSAERGWQVGKSLADRMYHMLTNQVDCDVTFVFPHAKPATKISAHKLVLKAGSPVFEAMFSGNFAETHADVEIIDVDPKVFNEMLRYFYTDDADVTADNVLPLMFAAKKYIVEGLTAMCSSFLTNKLDEQNVCKILNDSLVYGSESLAQNCCEFIGPRTESVIETAGFKCLSQDALGILLEYDDLVVKNEMLLYDACVDWARKRQTKSSSSDLDLRDTLGDCLHQIRFHGMRCEDFATKIGEANEILTAENKSHIYGYLITKSAKSKEKLAMMGFNTKERKQPVIKFPCYKSTTQVQFGMMGNIVEKIIFSHTSGPRVQLLGISVCGGRNAGESHDIHIELTDTPRLTSGGLLYPQSTRCLEKISKKMISTGNSEPIGIELSQRHQLIPNMQYTFTIRSDGPATYYKQGIIGGQSAHEGLSLMINEGRVAMQVNTRMAELLFSTG